MNDVKWGKDCFQTSLSTVRVFTERMCCPNVCVSVRFSVHLSRCPSVHLSVCISGCLSCPLFNLSSWVFFSACPFLCLYICSLFSSINIIEEKSNLRDLGVQVSSDLTFSIHIENGVLAATRMVGWVMRTFSRRSKFLMLTMWKTLIQSKLDYCSQRLINLGMYSQERRRERYQIICIWKLSQGLLTGYSLPFQQNERRGRYVAVPPMASNSPAAVKKAREASLKV